MFSPLLTLIILPLLLIRYDGRQATRLRRRRSAFITTIRLPITPLP